jgi:hypothetical protein
MDDCRGRPGPVRDRVGSWQAGLVPSPDATDAELRALLHRLKTASDLSYLKLGELATMAHQTAQNYITKPGWRRDTKTLESLLTALGATAQDRAHALELHRQTLPGRVDPAELDWAARGPGCGLHGVVDGRVQHDRGHGAHRDRSPSRPRAAARRARPACQRAPGPRRGAAPRHRRGCGR